MDYKDRRRRSPGVSRLPNAGKISTASDSSGLARSYLIKPFLAGDPTELQRRADKGIWNMQQISAVNVAAKKRSQRYQGFNLNDRDELEYSAPDAEALAAAQLEPHQVPIAITRRGSDLSDTGSLVARRPTDEELQFMPGGMLILQSPTALERLFEDPPTSETRISVFSVAQRPGDDGQPQVVSEGDALPTSLAGSPGRLMAGGVSGKLIRALLIGAGAAGAGYIGGKIAKRIIRLLRGQEDEPVSPSEIAADEFNGEVAGQASNGVTSPLDWASIYPGRSQFTPGTMTAALPFASGLMHLCWEMGDAFRSRQAAPTMSGDPVARCRASKMQIIDNTSFLSNFAAYRTPVVFVTPLGTLVTSPAPYAMMAGGFLKKLKKAAKKVGSAVKKVATVAKKIADNPIVKGVMSVIPGGAIVNSAVSAVGSIAEKVGQVSSTINGTDHPSGNLDNKSPSSNSKTASEDAMKQLAAAANSDVAASASQPVQIPVVVAQPTETQSHAGGATATDGTQAIAVSDQSERRKLLNTAIADRRDDAAQARLAALLDLTEHGAEAIDPNWMSVLNGTPLGRPSVMEPAIASAIQAAACSMLRNPLNRWANMKGYSPGIGTLSDYDKYDIAAQIVPGSLVYQCIAKALENGVDEDKAYVYPVVPIAMHLIWGSIAPTLDASITEKLGPLVTVAPMETGAAVDLVDVLTQDSGLAKELGIPRLMSDLSSLLASNADVAAILREKSHELSTKVGAAASSSITVDRLANLHSTAKRLKANKDDDELRLWDEEFDRLMNYDTVTTAGDPELDSSWQNSAVGGESTPIQNSLGKEDDVLSTLKAWDGVTPLSSEIVDYVTARARESSAVSPGPFLSSVWGLIRSKLNLQGMPNSATSWLTKIKDWITNSDGDESQSDEFLGLSGWQWLALVLIAAVLGYSAYKIYDDCRVSAEALGVDPNDKTPGLTLLKKIYGWDTLDGLIRQSHVYGIPIPINL